MADKTTRQTLGKITNLRMRCGSVMTRFSADVFPGLSHDVILGQPWLVKEDPCIQFRDGTVELQWGDTFHYLPTRVNLCIPTPKTVRQQVSDRIEDVEEQPPCAMVIIRPEGDTKAAVETIPKEHEGSNVDKLKRQELTKEITKVIDEY